jgi:uncharacterized damage-inducible protein DinB
MITPAYVRTMAAYNSEMNRRVYGAALTLDDAERRADRGAFWGSIEGTLAHVLWADRIWMARFGLGEAPVRPIAVSAAWEGSFGDLWTERQAFDAEIENWASAVRPEALEGPLTWFSGATGREMTRPRALCLMQVFNHQTHHRGQVHALLTAAGAETGATDLPFVLPQG